MGVGGGGGDKSVADPKFANFSRNPIQSSGGSRISPRRGRQLSRGGRQHTILPNFPKKLHEIERIWTPGGARVQNFTM